MDEDALRRAVGMAQRKLVVRVAEMLAFSRAPHTDREE
jgi:hypothetical protein